MIGVVVEVAQVDNVDPKPTKYRNPRGLIIQGVAVAKLLVEVHVEVASEYLETWHGLEDVVMGISQYRLLGRLVVLRAQVVIDRHMLHRAGRCVVEREIVPSASREFPSRFSTPRR